MTREHRGDGARKASRRKFRHTLLDVQIEKFRENMSPAAARFHARVAVDVMLSQGSTAQVMGSINNAE